MPILHAALVVGLCLSVAVLAAVRDRAAPPVVLPPMIGLFIAVVAAGALAVAFAVLRPRFPRRSASQSPDDFWSANETRASAVILWALVEGPGLLAGVAYFLTGQFVAVVVVIAAVLVLIRFRPVNLEAGDGCRARHYKPSFDKTKQATGVVGSRTGVIGSPPYDAGLFSRARAATAVDAWTVHQAGRRQSRHRAEGGIPLPVADERRGRRLGGVRDVQSGRGRARRKDLPALSRRGRQRSPRDRGPYVASRTRREQRWSAFPSAARARVVSGHRRAAAERMAGRCRGSARRRNRGRHVRAHLHAMEPRRPAAGGGNLAGPRHVDQTWPGVRARRGRQILAA